MPEVDRVIGNREKLTLEGLAPDTDERIAVGDIMAVRETAGHLIAGYEARARAFVQVQNGCDHRCTFCIIPLRPRPKPERTARRHRGRGPGAWLPTATGRWC